jgi:hypothetical protein
MGCRFFVAGSTIDAHGDGELVDSESEALPSQQLLYDVSCESDGGDRHGIVVRRLLHSALEDVSASITPSQHQPTCHLGGRGTTGAGRVRALNEGDGRLIAASSSSAERLLLRVVRDLFTAALDQQPFGDDVSEKIADMLTRDWTVRECRSVRWWIVQTCVLGTLFPEIAGVKSSSQLRKPQ